MSEFLFVAKTGGMMYRVVIQWPANGINRTMTRRTFGVFA